MAKTGGMNLDITPLLKGLDLTSAAAGKGGREGMTDAVYAWANDALFEEPTIPLKEGTLRGSGSQHVDGKLVGVSPDPSGKGTPNTDDLPGATVQAIRQGEMQDIVGVVAYNTVYAAHLHQATDYAFSQPGSGALFLSTPLEDHAKDYGRLVAGGVRKRLR